MSNSRLTIRFPLWVLCNDVTSLKYALEFKPVEYLKHYVSQLLQRLSEKSHIFLRRANLRVLSLPFRKFRPEFDYFYLAENMLFEVLNTREYNRDRRYIKVGMQDGWRRC